jgi:hypothetical protein
MPRNSHERDGKYSSERFEQEATIRQAITSLSARNIVVQNNCPLLMNTSYLVPTAIISILNFGTGMSQNLFMLLCCNLVATAEDTLTRECDDATIDDDRQSLGMMPKLADGTAAS